MCQKGGLFFTLVAPTLPKVETISQSNDANFLTEVSNSNKGSVVVQVTALAVALRFAELIITLDEWLHPEET